MARDGISGGDGRIDPATQTSRRRFLEATGVAGLIGGVGRLGLAQQRSTTFEFGGAVAGWQGRSPSAIEGETNPTLRLEAGTEYQVVWENLDGRPHDFVVRDDRGAELAGTEIASEQGATQSFSFTASAAMAQYVCTVHSSTMAGDVEIESAAPPTEETSPPQRFVPEGPTVGAKLVADGPLVHPVTLRTVPGTDDTHVVADQVGQVYLHRNGELREEPFLDLRDRVMVLAETDGDPERSAGFDERGLLGFAFHPNYRTNGQFYVRYSAPEPSDSLVGPGERKFPDDWDHVEILSEFRMAGDAVEITDENGPSPDAGTATQVGGDGRFRGDPASERLLLEVPQPQSDHNGGEVTFGPDGYLYTSLGDGGGANDTHPGHVDDWYDGNDGGNGQDVTENLLGSVLRIDVDREGEDTPYVVPDDNPLVGTDAMDEIWAWGLRNPWRMSFNDDRLVAADVGQALFEEVNVVERGGNYGWNVREGFHCFDAANATEPPDRCPTTAPDRPPYGGQELLGPVLEYPHTYQDDTVGRSITGGYTYEGNRLADLSGEYVFGAWSTALAKPRGRVFVATPGERGSGGTTTDGTPTDVGTTGARTDANVSTTDGATGTVSPSQEALDVLRPSEQPWQYRELLFEGGDGQQLNRFVQAFGRDASGNVYVLASRTGRLTDAAGEIYRLVPAGDGDEIRQPRATTPTPGDETPEAGGETETDGETEADGN